MSLGNDRLSFYNKIMGNYYNKNVDTLKLKELTGVVDVSIKYRKRLQNQSREPKRWYVDLTYKFKPFIEYKFVIDVTGRGSTTNCYNLKDLKLYKKDAIRKQAYRKVNLDELYIELHSIVSRRYI